MSKPMPTPSTGVSFPDSFNYSFDLDHDPEYQSSDEEEDEDVFAFVPPSTAVPEPTFKSYSSPHSSYPPEPPTPSSAVSALGSDVWQMKKLSNDGRPVTARPTSWTKAGSSKYSQSLMTDASSVASIKMSFDFDAIGDEDSPFPEVRASVSNIDDPDMPSTTVRAWVIGIFFCMLSAALNVFFNFRHAAPQIVPLALLLISHPVGKLAAFLLPIKTYRIPLPHFPHILVPPLPPPGGILHRLRTSVHLFFLAIACPCTIKFSLNPGPWAIKEHAIVFMMANVAVPPPYALNAIVVAEHYYGLRPGFGFGLSFILATQLTGFGLAGLCRRFLVWPASMVWPQALVGCTLLNTLHAGEEETAVADDNESGNGKRKISKGMSRYRFFMIVFVGAFLWSFVPSYLFQALSYFSFICWIFPKNIPVNQLFGVYSGLGMSVVTFDWTQISSWFGSPLMIPWWAEVHVFAGFVIFFWILTPILYYTNTWELSYFPMLSSVPYDKFGKEYNITQVLQPNGALDLAAYEAYSPLYLPAAFAVGYLVSFALATCAITHTILFHGKTLLAGFQRRQVEKDDIHAKLMKSYPEVPDWWYFVTLCIFFGLAIVTVEVWETGVPVWALFISILLPVLYILPSGFIFAMTGQGIYLNFIGQVIPGILLPGQPFANMVFKSYSVQTLYSAINFVQDLKFGHYIKVPPKVTFLAQLIATILACFVQIAVKTWLFANVDGICTPNQVSRLTCPNNRVFYTASAIWGLIGPSRQFGKGSMYYPHLFALIFGALLPVPLWLWQARYPKSWVRKISTPVVLTGIAFIPPATGINYSSWFAVAFVFQFLIRKANFRWWSKYNFLLSAALDVGTVVGLLVIFIALQYPKNGKILLNWWGNSVHMRTYDFARKSLHDPPEGGLIYNGP